MNIKTRLGIPTKKAIKELCDKHCLIINSLDNGAYGNCGRSSIAWGGHRADNDHAAEYVAADLRAAGFTVTVTPSDRKNGRNGILRITPKD